MGSSGVQFRCIDWDWIGLDWIGLDWIGLDWIGLDWIGLDWIGLDRSDWIGLDWIGLMSPIPIRAPLGTVSFLDLVPSIMECEEGKTVCVTYHCKCYSPK